MTVTAAQRTIAAMVLSLVLISTSMSPAGAARAGDAAAAPAAEHARGGAPPLTSELGRPWVLTSGSQLRLAPPPDHAATDAEPAEVEALASRRSAADLDQIRSWDAGAPGYRWNRLAVEHTQQRGVLGNRAVRMLTLLHVAIHDATLAAWDSKEAYGRPRPAVARPGLMTALATPGSPSYPDERAAAAGAAATVLAYVFPDDAATFARLADEAAQSRVLAGVAYPSDVAAGRELGERAGALVVEWARGDRSDAVWTGSVPTGPGIWTGTNPLEPLTGTWKTWVLASPDQYRPGPRAAVGSPELDAELAEVRQYARTNLTNLIASYWEYYGGRASYEYWNDQLGRKLFEERLDHDPLWAARAYALLNVAYYDAMVACWDAKFAYWAARPAQLDPAITTVFATPNHPSYPSAHGCLAGAAGTVLGALFPRDAAYFDTLVAQVSEARIMGGIHVRSDQVAGEALGRAVARTVLEQAGPPPAVAEGRPPLETQD